jgi:NAD(P)-dependent dehydrogenase (short-subunit alcohol dehydrogenase family)
MADLTGKVAVVTGAGSGAGRAVAWRLADEGCRVVAVGRRPEKLAETTAQYRGAGAVAAMPADIADRERVAQLVREVDREFGGIDILVNNAGVNIRRRSVATVSLDDWDYLIRVNLTGAFLMIHATLPVMRRRGGGLIINVASIAGVRSSVLGGVAYSASKFGMVGMSGVVAQEEAPYGIRCTVICPGEINTPILDDRPEPVPEERRRAMLQPEDIAAAVAFIASLPPRAHVPELIIKPTTQSFA